MSVTKSNQIAHMFDVFLPRKHFKKAVFGYNMTVLKKNYIGLEGVSDPFRLYNLF